MKLIFEFSLRDAKRAADLITNNNFDIKMGFVQTHTNVWEVEIDLDAVEYDIFCDFLNTEEIEYASSYC